MQWSKRDDVDPGQGSSNCAAAAITPPIDWLRDYHAIDIEESFRGHIMTGPSPENEIR